MCAYVYVDVFELRLKDLQTDDVVLGPIGRTVGGQVLLPGGFWDC